MTEEAQQIAIEEACGRKPGQYRCSRCGKNVPRHAQSVTSGGYHSPEGGCGGRLENAPQYLSDLNAMNEAEGALTPRSRESYPQYLSQVSGIGEGVEWTADEDWTIIHAAAAQRAEAFLKTIGKWVD